MLCCRQRACQTSKQFQNCKWQNVKWAFNVLRSERRPSTLPQYDRLDLGSHTTNTVLITICQSSWHASIVTHSARSTPVTVRRPLVTVFFISFVPNVWRHFWQYSSIRVYALPQARVLVYRNECISTVSFSLSMCVCVCVDTCVCMRCDTHCDSEWSPFQWVFEKCHCTALDKWPTKWRKMKWNELKIGCHGNTVA